MSMDYMDFFDQGSSSNCCGDLIDLHGMCRGCGEHCVDESEEGPSDEKLERMNDSYQRKHEQEMLRLDKEDRAIRDAGRGHLVR